jgi:hypothetical protein
MMHAEAKSSRRGHKVPQTNKKLLLLPPSPLAVAAAAL